MEYITWIFKDEDRAEYVAIVPDIEECIASRDSFEEICEVIQDAAELCLEDEDLPVAHTLDYFTEEILSELSIPLSSSNYRLKVEEEEDEQSYEAEIILE